MLLCTFLKRKNAFILCSLALILPSLLISREQERDILLEFKAAYFQPTGSLFRHIYGGSALFGPEVTFKLKNQWYGFASVDYLTKNGKSLGLRTSTHVNLLPLGIGLKYLWCMNDYSQFYAGLGFQPVYVMLENCSPYVAKNQNKWGFGGIAKIGAFVDLPHHFFLDFFVDYSFVKVPFKNSVVPAGYVQPHKANVSGAIFGAGVGYRFN